MKGWTDLGYPAVHWPGVKLAISRSQVWHLNHYTSEQPSYDVLVIHSCIVCQNLCINLTVFLTLYQLNQVSVFVRTCALILQYFWHYINWTKCQYLSGRQELEIVSVQFASESWRWQSCVRLDDTKGQKYSWNNGAKYNDSWGTRKDSVFAFG